MNAANSYNVLTEYTVEQEKLPDFLAAYHPTGSWPLFLKQADGYLQSRLLADDEHENVYVSIDRWATKDAYNTFTSADAYRELDLQLQSVAGVKRRIGGYAAIE
jgi:heme-degrading monooxygenase HmoA